MALDSARSSCCPRVGLPACGPARPLSELKERLSEPPHRALMQAQKISNELSTFFLHVFCTLPTYSTNWGRMVTLLVTSPHLSFLLAGVPVVFRCATRLS